MTRVALAGLEVHPLCLGGNVFGWTSDEATSFAVLDAYVAAGGNFIDTADSYSVWIPGLSGGESETIIGRWLQRRARRDDLVIATKVGRLPDFPGLSRKSIIGGLEASLRRLHTDYVDVYFTHVDDETVPLTETLRALDELVRAGKVRYLGASNYSATRLEQALAVARAERLAPFVAYQHEYNLVERAGYEAKHQAVCAAEGVAFMPYYSLANGFLTGKYRSGQVPESARSAKASRYLDQRGAAVLAVLDELAAAHRTNVAAVALAWLARQPTVTTPVASARTPAQLAALLEFTDLRLADDEVAQLDTITAPLPS